MFESRRWRARVALIMCGRVQHGKGMQYGHWMHHQALPLQRLNVHKTKWRGRAWEWGYTFGVKLAHAHEGYVFHLSLSCLSTDDLYATKMDMPANFLWNSQLRDFAFFHCLVSRPPFPATMVKGRSPTRRKEGLATLEQFLCSLEEFAKTQRDSRCDKLTAGALSMQVICQWDNMEQIVELQVFLASERGYT